MRMPMALGPTAQGLPLAMAAAVRRYGRQRFQPLGDGMIVAGVHGLPRW